MRTKWFAYTALAAVACFTGGATYAANQSPSVPTYGSLSAQPFVFQQVAEDCVEASASIIATVMGTPTTEQQAIVAAGDAYSATGGTQWAGVVPMFARLGFTANLEQGITVQQLEDALKEGHGVQLMVNANSLWALTGGGSDGSTDMTDPNHAVVLDQIKGDTVSITDTGTNRNETITVVQLENVWALNAVTTIIN